MLPIVKKEFNTFFSSPIAYMVIGVFLIVNGLFLWVFDDEFNILNAGFADINSLFFLSPWLFLFLIPALTMKSFADEFHQGTIETLLTKPISVQQVVLGKFLAAFLLIIIAIAPTIIYVYTVSALGNPIGNIDLGSTLGSYIGLLLLASSFTAVGIFSSTLSKNQLIAFLIALVLSFFLFYGFDAIASLFGSGSYTVQKLGFNEHFKSLSRGVLDTRDVIYFASITLFFLLLTKKAIQS